MAAWEALWLGMVVLLALETDLARYFLDGDVT